MCRTPMQAPLLLMGPEEVAIYGEDAAATNGDADADGPTAKRQRVDGGDIEDVAQVGHEESLACRLACICCACVLLATAAALG